MALTVSQSFTKVHGGIYSDQSLKGNLRFFQIEGTGIFANTISDGTVVISDMPAFGGNNFVGVGKPVPKSAAELAFQVITSRYSVCKITIISDDAIQFAIENGVDEADYDRTQMELDVQTLGTQAVPSPSGLVNVDFSTVAITEYPIFKLA